MDPQKINNAYQLDWLDRKNEIKERDTGDLLPLLATYQIRIHDLHFGRATPFRVSASRYHGYLAQHSSELMIKSRDL